MKPVLIYTKTSCPYSRRAKAFLSQKGVPFEEVDIEQEPERRREMIEAAHGRTSTPEILIGGEWLGGMEDLEHLEHKGELDRMLRDSGGNQPNA